MDQPSTADEELHRKFQGLILDLNLDQVTADEAWSNYESLKLRYDMEGDQLSWVACSVYGSCMQRVLPTVGGRGPESTIQGNCVSLTRMLKYCEITFMEFIKKKRLWVKMINLDEKYARSVDLLETKFAVSNNIFKKYRPIFLDLFNDPEKDAKRPPRSRKQRRPPCNASELYDFCWSLYILIKGKYPTITQDLVMCFSLLLSCVDLMYANVRCMGRTDLLNPSSEGYPRDAYNSESGFDVNRLPESIMDYLCHKYSGVIVDTKVVQQFHWKENVKRLVEKKLLKGSPNGLCLLDSQHFDHNIKEVKNSYEADLLSNGEFDERTFLSNDKVLGLVAGGSMSPIASAPVTPMPHLPKRGQLMPFDYHLMMPQTPLSNKQGSSHVNSSPVPGVLMSPMAATRKALNKLYNLIQGKTAEPTESLKEMLNNIAPDTLEHIKQLLQDMGKRFCSLYVERQGSSPVDGCYAKLRLKCTQILFYTFLETILKDEARRGSNNQSVAKPELFVRTLFVFCIELVLTSHNDSRRFPWSLQVGEVDAFYFQRIVEPVVRAEQNYNNRLSRDLINHLKRVEEQVLDSLAWQSSSPFWEILKNGAKVPSCQDVNFSHSLDSGNNNELAPPLPPNSLPSNSIQMSPAAYGRCRPYSSPRRSPLSSAASDRLGLQSPPGGSKGSAKRTLLFPSDSKTSCSLPPPTLPAPSVVVSSINSSSQSLSSINSPEGGERPRIQGSFAIFFRKVYNLGNLRLTDLCNKLDITSSEMRRKIWTCFEFSLMERTELLRDRNLDQLIMCAIYTMCKVSRQDCRFQDILKQYRSQPQANYHIYRSVLIKRFNPDSRASNGNEDRQPQSRGTLADGHPVTASKRLGILDLNGTSTSFNSEERGDLIKFYNNVYIPSVEVFAVRFRPSNQEGSNPNAPPLSPLPVLRRTPASPRHRISSTRNIFICNLSPASSAAAASPSQPLPYVFKESPSKQLHTINSAVQQNRSFGLKRPLVESGTNVPSAKRPVINLSRRINTLIDERQRSTSGSLNGSPLVILRNDSSDSSNSRERSTPTPESHIHHENETNDNDEDC